MKTKKENELVEIFAGSSIEAEIVRSLLNDSDIEAFLKDEYMGTIAPWHVAPGGVGSVKVVVSRVSYSKAKSVVDGYHKNSG
jgi:hypothetical protein